MRFTEFLITGPLEWVKDETFMFTPKSFVIDWANMCLNLSRAANIVTRGRIGFSDIDRADIEEKYKFLAFP